MNKNNSEGKLCMRHNIIKGDGLTGIISTLVALAVSRLSKLDVHWRLGLWSEAHAIRVIAVGKSDHPFPKKTLSTAVTLLQPTTDILVNKYLWCRLTEYFTVQQCKSHFVRAIWSVTTCFSSYEELSLVTVAVQKIESFLLAVSHSSIKLKI